MLANFKNFLTGKPVFFEESLPQHELENQKRANELGLLTTITNCRVKLFLKSYNGLMTQLIDSVKAVEDL